MAIGGILKKIGVWVPIDQNGTSFRQIVETDGMAYAELVEKVYRGIDLFLVHSMDNSFIFIFPMAFFIFSIELQ